MSGHLYFESTKLSNHVHGLWDIHHTIWEDGVGHRGQYKSEFVFVHFVVASASERARVDYIHLVGGGYHILQRALGNTSAKKHVLVAVQVRGVYDPAASSDAVDVGGSREDIKALTEPVDQIMAIRLDWGVRHRHVDLHDGIARGGRVMLHLIAVDGLFDASSVVLDCLATRDA